MIEPLEACRIVSICLVLEPSTLEARYLCPLTVNSTATPACSSVISIPCTTYGTHWTPHGNLNLSLTPLSSPAIGASIYCELISHVRHAATIQLFCDSYTKATTCTTKHKPHLRVDHIVVGHRSAFAPPVRSCDAGSALIAG